MTPTMTSKTTTMPDSTATGPDKRDYLSRPIIGVGAVVWHGNDVLLIRRGKSPNKGQWSLPGGAQDLGETLHDAVRREVFEETGITISEPILIDTVDLITRDITGRVQYHYTLIDFLAEASETVLSAGGDAADARWVSQDDLANYHLWDKTIVMIERARDLRETPLGLPSF